MLKQNDLIYYYTKQLKKKKYIDLVEHCNKYIILPKSETVIPGRFDIYKTPYMIEPAKKLSFRSQCQEIVLQTGAQLGKTRLCLNFIDYCVRHGSGNIMYIMPTAESVKNFSRVRLSPTLQMCVDDDGNKMEEGTRKKNTTLLLKKFKNGHIILTGANSPIGLRAYPCKFLIMDEVDAFPENSGGEGNPIDLAKNRTATYSLRRKILYTSTPKFKFTSNIETNFNEGSQKKYFVPCPICGSKQILNFNNLIYKIRANNKLKCYDVFYKCDKCQDLITESKKTQMLIKGEWIGLNHNVKKETYHLNSLYSPLGMLSWENIINSYLEAKQSVEKMITFKNTILAETVEKNYGEIIDVNRLSVTHKEIYKAQVPNGVLVLTAGVDNQDDRLAVEIAGWGHNEERWSIDYQEIYGKLTDHSTWDTLEKYLTQKFTDENGDLRTVAAVAIDTGGHYTKEVYNFCKYRESRRYYALKGASKLDADIIHSKSRNNAAKCLLYIVGVTKIKDIMFERLGIIDKSKAGFCHFPAKYDNNYFDMLTSEKKVKRRKNGITKMMYVKTKERNEALDCFVYNYFAMINLNPNFEKIEENLNKLRKKEEKTKEIDKKIVNKKSIFPHKKGWVNRI